MSKQASTSNEIGVGAVEVIVMWGTQSVLDVKHLSPLRTYLIGEAREDVRDPQPTIDFVVSASQLSGRQQLPLVFVDGDRVCVSITREMTGVIAHEGQVHALETLRDQGAWPVSHDVIGAWACPLQPGSHLEIALGELRFIVRPMVAMPVLAAARGRVAWDAYAWVMGSLLFHGFFLVAFYFLPPSAMARNFDLTNVDRRYIDYVIQPPELEEPDLPELVGDNASGEDGKRHDGDNGQMGKPDKPRTKAHHAIAGDAKPEDRAMSRDQAQQMAKSTGVIGMIKAAMGSWNTPTSPYGREQAIGGDPMNAIGAIMGDYAGDNFGFGGLGDKGTGRGGGGDGQGTVGVGDLGTIGTDVGPGGHGSKYGSTVGTLGGHNARVPKLTIGKAEVTGGLAKEAIRRVIHRHLAEVRHCYEQELNARPDLEGRVAVKFLINRDGVVQMALVTQSSLGNPRAEGCIQQALQRWTFPASEGISTVSYPFVFARAGE